MSAGDIVQAQNYFFASFDCRERAEPFYELPVEVITIDSSLLLSEVIEPLVLIDTIDGWKNWQYVENFSFGKNRGTIPMITALDALHPYFRDKVSELISICGEKGIELAIVETYRTHAKQDEYKVMGRGYTSSRAGKSKHQYGLAVDLVPVIDSVAVWNNVVLWKKVGTIGERLGLRWGGRWRKPYDPGHFEWTGGMTTSDLFSGSFPEVPNKDQQYPCLEEDLRRLTRYWKEWETSQSSFTRK